MFVAIVIFTVYDVVYLLGTGTCTYQVVRDRVTVDKVPVCLLPVVFNTLATIGSIVNFHVSLKRQCNFRVSP